MSQTETVEQNMKELMVECTTKLKELSESKYNEQIEKVNEILEELLVFDHEDEEYEMVDFLTHATVCAYYNLFGKDIAVDRNREFGCEGVEDAISCLHEIGGLSKSQQEEVERVGVNLLANIRQTNRFRFLYTTRISRPRCTSYVFSFISSNRREIGFRGRN